MKKLLLIVLGLVVVLIGAALAAPFLIPTETYKQQIAAQVERATGRSLTIAGPLEFTLLPTVALRAEDARFANLPGAAEADMVRLKALEAELAIWPLLRGSVEVARFVLVEPVIHLEVDAEGRANWQLGTPATTEEAPADGAEGPGTTLPITELKLGDIRIENGTLTYADATSGTSERVEALNLSIELPDLRSPLHADGSAEYKGEKVALEVALAAPLDVIQGGSSPLRLEVDAAPVELGFEGVVSNGTEPGATGGLELAVPSIRKLAAWLAEPIAFAGEGLERLSISGQLSGSPTRVAFTDAALGLDAIEGRGEFVVELGGAVPRLSGRLDLGAVDLNPYLPPEAAAPPAGSEQAPAGQSEAPPDGEPGTGGGWSDEPIAVPPIGGVEAAFTLTVDALRVRDLELGRSVLALTLQDNTLEAALEEFALYDGRGNGTLRVTVEDGMPVVRKQFRLEGLQALPFLTAAAGFDRLEGTASAELQLATRGRSERELVQNLNGEGRVTFLDGAIVGINLAAMVRNVATAFTDPRAGEARRTDFAELSGSFRIQDGILTNDDMRLQAPAIRVTGRGRIDLPARTIAYRIEPKAATTLEGQGGRQDVAGLLVPVIIEGPWDDLSYRPDLSGVVESAIRDPEAVKEQIKQLGDQGEALKEALKGLDKKEGREALIEGLGKALGGGQPAPQGEGSTEGTAEPQEPVQKLLKGLLGN